MVLFLGCLLLVFRHPPPQKKTWPATQESRLRGCRGTSSNSLLTWPSPKNPWVLSTLFVGRNFRGGEGSPENPWRKGWTYPYYSRCVWRWCFLLICMHSKKKKHSKWQPKKEKKHRYLNSKKRDSRKWRNAKGFIPRKFSHDAILAVSWKYPRHAWIIGVSKCPRRFSPRKKDLKISPFCPEREHIRSRRCTCKLQGMKFRLC